MRTNDVFVTVWNLHIYSFHFNASQTINQNPLLLNSMSMIEDSPLSVETPAILAHGTNTQANTTHHMDAAALGVEGRRYVVK